MRSPQTIGVAPLGPGSGSFQATFSLSSHFVARPVSLLTPSPVGPRHCGQLSARAAASAASETRTAKPNRRMAGYLKAGTWGGEGAVVVTGGGPGGDINGTAGRRPT